MTRITEADYQQFKDQILDIREQVFIHEQGVPTELEIDDQDPLSKHVLLFDDGHPIATGRLTPDGHIGRLAVLKNFRQRGHGRQLINKLEQIAKQSELHEVKLGAQRQAIDFYKKLGYQSYGDIFMDAGIEHRMMKKALL